MEAVDERAVMARRLRGVALSIALVAAFEVGMILLRDRPPLRHAWVDAGWTLASLAAAIRLGRASERAAGPATRNGLRVAAIGCGTWTLGMLVWSYDELVRGRITPFPSVADGFFVLLPICLTISFSFLGAVRGRMALSLKFATDVVVMLFAVAMLCVIVFAGHGGSDDPVARTVAVVHLATHLGCLVVAALALATYAYRKVQRRVLRLFTYALAVLGIVEAHYSRGVLDRTYVAGDALDFMWVAAFALLYAAANEHDFEPTDEPDQLVPPLHLDLHVPIAMVALAGALVVYGERMASSDVKLFAILGFAFALATLVRAVVAAQLEIAARAEAIERDRRIASAQRLEVVGLVAGGLAHDFNNLLTSVLGHVGILRRRRDATVVDQSLDVMEHATLRAAALSRRLLSLARSRTPEMRAGEPGDVLRRVAGMIRPVCPEGVALEVTSDPDVGTSLFDAGQLEQALMNLALNAVRAVGTHGNVALRLRCERTGRGHALVFEVEDDGPGLPEELMTQRFLPFVTTRADQGGHGLGLPAVQTIAEAHGGTLEVRSEAGKGSVFAIRFPRVAAEPERKPDDGIDGAHGGFESVVAVDDQAGALLAMRAALELGGYQVAVCNDPTAAVDLARARRASLVVTDADMPGLHGTVLVERLREAVPGVRILMVSADDREEHRTCADAFLAKPFTVEALLRSARRTLDGAG